MSSSLFPFPSTFPSRSRAEQPDAGLDRALRRAVLAGIALVLLVPLARGSVAWLGWLPLWLVGMPAAAWWALHRFRLPGGGERRRQQARRRRQAQARRSARPAPAAARRAA